MKAKRSDIAISLITNLITIDLYLIFPASHFGVIGLVYVFSIAFVVCLFIYKFRNEIYIVDAVLGFGCLMAMIYIVMFKKDWPLFAMEITMLIVVYSVSYFYFDWKRLNTR